MKKTLIRPIFVIIALCFVLMSAGCSKAVEQAVGQAIKGNIISGEWNGDTFTNTWSGITFTLPSDFKSLTPDEMQSTLGAGQEIVVNGQSQASDLSAMKTLFDFDLVNKDDGLSNVMLCYENLMIGQQQKITPEDYFNIIKEQNSTEGYVFSDTTSSKIIGEEEYLLAQSTVTVENGIVIYVDYYIRKYDNAIIMFNAIYLDDSKDSVDSLLSSIKKVS